MALRNLLCIAMFSMVASVGASTMARADALALNLSSAADSDLREHSSRVLRPWGIEADLVQPFVPEVHIFTLKGTRTLWGTEGRLRGDGVVGVYLRPNVEHNVVERIDEYAGMLGYRQYFIRGLHAEALTYLGYARGENNRINGRDYSDFAWLAELSAGYRQDLGPAYVAVQGGYLVGVYTNIGPRKDPDRFVTGKLLVGVAF